MPASSAEILRRVGVASDSLNLDRDGRWRAAGERLLVQDGPLWPRKEHTTMTDQIAPPGTRGTSSTDTPAAVPPAAASAAPAAGTAAPVSSPSSPSVGPSDAGTPSPASVDGRISIDDFMKVELRVAKVLAAERVPKSKKLLKLSVDVGTEQRTVLAGIAESYEPEALVGRTIAVVFNLRPAKLMGIESNGMVLAASPDGGKAVLVSFDEPLAPGTRIR